MLRRVASIALLCVSACFEDVRPQEDDDGDTDDAGSGTTAAPVCGDGVLDEAEPCDDGNDIDGDGCSQCQRSGTVVWSKIEGSVGSMVQESATDVAIDAEGRVFVSGVVAGGNSADIWVRSFDGDGNVLWSATEHRGEDFGAGVAADGEGGVYVAGLLGGGMGGALDPWLAHFDATGTSTFETAVQVEMTWGAAVDVAVAGDVLLTNGFRLSGIATDAVVMEFGLDGEPTGREYLVDAGLTDSGWRIESDGARVRASAFLSAGAGVGGWNDGFDPEPSWIASIPGAVQSSSFNAMDGYQPIAIALHGDDTFACATVSSGDNLNFQLSRINGDGEIQWSEQHDAGATEACGGLAVDGAGDVIVVGTSAVGDAEHSIAIAKYTANADLVWEATLEHEGGIANGVEVGVGPDGGIFVVGAVGTMADIDIYVARLVP